MVSSSKTWGLSVVCLCQGGVWGGFLHSYTLGFGVFPNKVPLFHKKSCSQHSGFIYSKSFESILQYSWCTRSSLIFFTFSCRGRMKQQSNIYFRSQQSQLYQGLSEPFQINSQIFCWMFFPLLLGKTQASAALSLGHFPSCSCLISLGIFFSRKFGSNEGI